MAATDVPSSLSELRPEAQYGRLPFDKFLVVRSITTRESPFPLTQLKGVVGLYEFRFGLFPFSQAS